MVPPPRQTRLPVTLHPSNKSGHLYAQDMRAAVMQVLNLGRFNDPLIQDLRYNQLFPSHRTCKRFVAAISEYDQVLFEDATAKRMTKAIDLFEEIYTQI